MYDQHETKDRYVFIGGANPDKGDQMLVQSERMLQESWGRDDLGSDYFEEMDRLFIMGHFLRGTWVDRRNIGPDGLHGDERLMLEQVRKNNVDTRADDDQWCCFETACERCGLRIMHVATTHSVAWGYVETPPLCQGCMTDA